MSASAFLFNSGVKATCESMVRSQNLWNNKHIPTGDDGDCSVDPVGTSDGPKVFWVVNRTPRIEPPVWLGTKTTQFRRIP